MKEDIFRAKLAADQGLQDIFESDAETSYDYAHELRGEIKEIKARLKKLEAAYKVYHGFHMMGMDLWENIHEATYEAGIEEAEQGNKDIAVKLLKDSASHDYVPAKIALAKAYVYGEYGIKRNPEEGLSILKEAADEGDGEACLLFTTIHDDYPELVGPDVALEMCQRAAAMNYGPALERLEKPFDMSEETKKLLARLASGEKGVAFWLSTRGDLSNKDRKKYFLASVEEGDPMAELEMGYTLLRKKDKKGAKEYFQKASDHGSGPACFALIDVILGGKPHYYKGPEIPNPEDPVYQQEFKLIERAAEIGDNRGLCILGRSYVRGYMVEKDLKKAKKLLEKALSQGEKDLAPQMLAEIYEQSKEEGSASKAVEYYELSADHGNVASMLALKGIYENGLREVKKNSRKAMYYALRSGAEHW